MPPRARRPRRRKPNTSLALIQVAVLTAMLVILLLFRGHISTTLTSLLDAFGGGPTDVSVAPQSEDAPAATPATSPSEAHEQTTGDAPTP